MSLSGSVSRWIKGAKTGCERAATGLWGRYRVMLLAVARKKLRIAPKSVSDEEDIVVEAFQSFLRRCRQGHYSKVRDRDDLGRLLVAITIHKSTNQVRNQLRQKRVGRTAGKSSEPAVVNGFQALDQLPGGEPSPEFVPKIRDSLNMLLSNFADRELRSIVLYKLEGCSNREIADKIGRSLVTVQRRLRLIRDQWEEELSH